MALLHIFKILKHYYFSRAGVSPNGDASTILNYLSTLVSVAQFDALSPYHPTSEGILAKLMKRPYHERSMESKNIAAIFAGRLLIQTVLMVSYTLKNRIIQITIYYYTCHSTASKFVILKFKLVGA